jgi:hypothetical protein
VEFESGVDLHPIQATAAPDSRVFYIRYRTVRPHPERQAEPGRFGRGRWDAAGPEGRRPGYRRQEMEIDQLEPTLKPLAPRVFDVETPEEFRKALATIVAEIAKM